jgi:CAAX prenyl protease-like protein
MDRVRRNPLATPRPVDYNSPAMTDPSSPPASRDRSTVRRIAPYAIPFLLYVIPTTFETREWLGLGYEVVYTLKTTLCAGALWIYRKDYPRFESAGFGLAGLAGIFGVVLWIGLAWLQTQFPALQHWIETVQGTRAAYDPFADDGPAWLRIAFLSVRLISLAVIVPIMEEIFWRGFLARYLIADDFRSVPPGVFTRFSFIAVTLAFASVHTELLAAIVWGALVNEVYRRTSNLWACVVMHAVTNGLLGGYILLTASWQLW